MWRIVLRRSEVFKNEKHAGTFGLFGVISFNGNKIISTGGGGMILTNEKDLAIKAKHITTTAKTNLLNIFMITSDIITVW